MQIGDMATAYTFKVSFYYTAAKAASREKVSKMPIERRRKKYFMQPQNPSLEVALTNYRLYYLFTVSGSCLLLCHVAGSGFPNFTFIHFSRKRNTFPPQP